MYRAIRFAVNLSGFAPKRSVDHVLYITPTRVIGASQWKSCSGLYMVWHNTCTSNYLPLWPLIFLQSSVYLAAAVFAVFAAEHPIISVLSHQMALLCLDRLLMAATRDQVWRVPGGKKAVKEKWETVRRVLNQSQVLQACCPSMKNIF